MRLSWDGTQTLQMLAQAGIASTNLIEDETTRTFADRQTTFTPTNGTTGTPRRSVSSMKLPALR
ncbi:hypothetical protein F7D13_12430 [Methylocystis rosea]|uniref:Uncharacterized protein n=1 Tax=Methylocystis rosea TaxID=173366 RepID=A0ABX6ELI6_9HYPH|nr:hypothetical protein [Methylocystis rosea]QGM94762.1 hypothetical protein F7D13_12430 [Methylocystis rosea]